MKIECPKCKLAGEIPDDTVPSEGKNIDCPRCKTAFLIGGPSPLSWADLFTDCPNCGYTDFNGKRFEKCPTCGLQARGYVKPKKNIPKTDFHGPEMAATENDAGLERLTGKSSGTYGEVLNKDVIVPGTSPRSAAPLDFDMPLLLKCLGWFFMCGGLAMVVWGIVGFYEYGEFRSRSIASTPGDHPGLFKGFLFLGFFPTFRILLGVFAFGAGSEFMKMRPWTRKGLEIAAWGGIGYVVLNEVAKMLGWFSRSSGSASFFYVFAGMVDALLMIPLWSAPLLMIIWYLHGDTIAGIFKE